jgi:hypothetical protein
VRFRGGVVLLSVLLFGGCAFTEDSVVLSYRPRAPAPQLQEAQSVTVAVVVRAAAEADLEVKVFGPGPPQAAPLLYEGRAAGSGKNENI